MRRGARLSPAAGAAAALPDRGAVAAAARVEAPDSARASGARALIQAARSQVGLTVVHDPAHVTLAYPGGDVPLERGVCTDAVIRAVRRVPNLQTCFHRRGCSVPVTRAPADLRPGERVTSMLPGNRTHIVTVNDRKTEAGAPFLIRAVGAGTKEADALFAFPITDHVRPPPTLGGTTARSPGARRGAAPDDGSSSPPRAAPAGATRPAPPKGTAWTR